MFVEALTSKLMTCIIHFPAQREVSPLPQAWLSALRLIWANKSTWHNMQKAEEHAIAPLHLVTHTTPR